MAQPKNKDVYNATIKLFGSEPRCGAAAGAATTTSGGSALSSCTGRATSSA
jgi:hypothetical protein